MLVYLFATFNCFIFSIPKASLSTSSSLYKNANCPSNESNYQSMDELPLPPPPPLTSFQQLSTSWSNQQMGGNSNFPPPPPEMSPDSHTYVSDINGNQFRCDNKSFDGKANQTLYANLHSHLPSGVRYH